MLVAFHFRHFLVIFLSKKKCSLPASSHHTPSRLPRSIQIAIRQWLPRIFLSSQWHMSASASHASVSPYPLLILSCLSNSQITIPIFVLVAALNKIVATESCFNKVENQNALLCVGSRIYEIPLTNYLYQWQH
jgi:hypothetical protein